MSNNVTGMVLLSSAKKHIKCYTIKYKKSYTSVIFSLSDRIHFLFMFYVSNRINSNIFGGLEINCEGS